MSPAALISSFASVRIAIALIILMAIMVLIGAWCPQEAQVGYEKVVETFGSDTATKLRSMGITDIFHTPFFLLLVALLYFNMIVVSFKRVFPKAKNFKHKMPFLKAADIAKMPISDELVLHGSAESVLETLRQRLRKNGYFIKTKDGALTAEFGKVSMLAATVTHIGLILLLTGVTITSWTGFSGFKPVLLGSTMSFADSEHSKLWIGKLPDWKIRVVDTRKEDYENGDPKQWYSKLAVIDKQGKAIKEQEISVNNPLSYDGVDIYQSSWGLDSLLISFNDRLTRLPLQQMGGTHASFMPLDQNTTLIFSLRGTAKPVRIFAKIPDWKTPKMLAEVPAGYAAKFGNIEIGYLKALPRTGLQYKCDPGLPITYTAFGIIMLGVLLAAIPHRQLWAEITTDEAMVTLNMGGTSRKAKSAFKRSLEKACLELKEKFSEANASLGTPKEDICGQSTLSCSSQGKG